MIIYLFIFFSVFKLSKKPQTLQSLVCLGVFFTVFCMKRKSWSSINQFVWQKNTLWMKWLTSVSGEIKSGDVFLFFFSFRKGANLAMTWSAHTWWRTKTGGFALEAFFKDCAASWSRFMQHVIEHKLQILISVDELLYVRGQSWNVKEGEFSSNELTFELRGLNCIAFGLG